MFVRFSFLSLMGPTSGWTKEVARVSSSSANGLPPIPSTLLFRVFLGVTEGVAVGVVLLEARETLLISSVLPFPEILL